MLIGGLEKHKQLKVILWEWLLGASDIILYELKISDS